jgi:hypothetical protein
LAKRANGEGSIHRRKDGRWAASVSVGRGKRQHFLSKDRDVVARKLRAALKGQDDGLPAIVEKQTVEQFMQSWLKATKPKLRERTWVRYEQYVRLHIVPSIGKLAALPMLLIPLTLLIAASRLLSTAPFSRPSRITYFIRDGVESVTRLSRDRALVAQWSVLTIGLLCLVALQYWLAAASLTSGVAFHEAWVAFGVSQLVGIVTLLPLGLGSSDAVLVALYRRFGLTFDEAASGAVLVRAINTLPLILIAALAYTYLHMQRTRIPPRGQLRSRA